VWWSQQNTAYVNDDAVGINVDEVLFNMEQSWQCACGVDPQGARTVTSPQLTPSEESHINLKRYLRITFLFRTSNQSSVFPTGWSFFVFQSVNTGCGGWPVFYLVGTQGSFSGSRKYYLLKRSEPIVFGIRCLIHFLSRVYNKFCFPGQLCFFQCSGVPYIYGKESLI
jgi:hypothetical protein